MGAWGLGLEPGTWDLKPGSGLGPGSLGHGSLEPEAWNLEPGAWGLKLEADWSLGLDWSLSLKPRACPALGPKAWVGGMSR